MGRLCAGVAAILAAAPAFGFDLIAGPAAQTGDAPSAEPSIATPYAPTATQDYDRGGLFDEIRVGGSGSLDDSSDEIAIGGTVLFDPLLLRFESAFATDLLSPRPLLGFAVSPDGGANQLHAGFSWDVQITDIFFLEASFGGAVHDGQLELDEADADQMLRCRFAFRQSAGAGLEISDRLRLVASLDHASDAGLCGESSGLTHAGAAIGLKF